VHLRQAQYLGEKNQNFKQRGDTLERGTKQTKKKSDSTVNARHNNKKKASEERVLCNSYRAISSHDLIRKSRTGHLGH